MGSIEAAMVSIEAGFIEVGFIEVSFIETEFEAAAGAARLAERDLVRERVLAEREALLTKTSEQLHDAVNRQAQLEVGRWVRANQLPGPAQGGKMGRCHATTRPSSRWRDGWVP